MGKLKISKRLKNPFKKQASGGSILSDDNRSVASVVSGDFASPIVSPAASQASPAISSPIPNILSIETTATGSTTSSAAASSLNSEQRDHGPIDIDSCRKYKGGKKKDRAGRRNNFKKIRGGTVRKKERGGSLMAGDSATGSLPKIVESRSATPASLSMSYNSGPETPASAPGTGVSSIYDGSDSTPHASPIDGMGGGSPVSPISENDATLSSMIQGSPRGSAVDSDVGLALASSEQKRQLARELSQQSAGSERKRLLAREYSQQSAQSAPSTQSTGSQPRSPLSSFSRAQSLNQHSPGAETVSTINGKDVFERSRSSQSMTNRGGARASGSARTLSSSKLPLPKNEESNIASLFSSPRRKKGSPKISTGSSQTDAHLTPSTTNEINVAEWSPGAQSVSTINGKDIFERSRSSMSCRAALQRKMSPLRQPRSTEARSPSPPPKKSPKLPSRMSQATKSASTPASPKNLRDTTPRIQKRNRSGSSQIAVRNEGNRELSLPPPSVDSTPNPRNKDVKVEEQLTPEKDDDGQESKPKPSPTSVVHMFGSEYPVEIDPVESHDDTFFEPCACDAVDDKSSVVSAPVASASSPMQYGRPTLPKRRASSQQKLPQYPRTRSLQSEPQQPPPLPPAGSLQPEGPLPLRARPPTTPTTKKKSKAKASFSESKTKKSSIELSKPESSSHSPPPRQFGLQSESSNTPSKIKRASPTKMFSDAYTSLEDAVAAHAAMLSGPAVRPDTSSVAGDSVASSSLGGLSRSSNPEFLARKKGAEKGEFKKVALLKKAEQAAATGGLQETIEIQALERSLTMEGDRMERKQGMEPPGIDATNTRSTSPMPPSPNSFLEETGSQLSTTLLSVDVIQSFSFDQELGVQYSLSDDSWNSLSDLESIGEITICDETTRLLKAHKLYENDALTNKNHPSRRMGSAMKVGSRFRQESAAMNMSGQFDCTTIPTDDTVANSKEEDGKKKRLTWYDDEENWHKPFTLRTDESFDASTVTSDKGGPVERIIRNNVVPNVNQVLGEFIKGIGRYTACGGEDDVASFDVVSGEQEI